MDLRQLQAVVAIADHGSFSAAAAALHTVQSNVSSHVARLERELGVQLVDRHDGQLTEEGQAVVERARRIAAELDAVVSDVAALRHEVTGTLRMGIISTTGRWLAPLLLERLADEHPAIHPVIEDGTSTSLEPRLLAGSLDLIVINLARTNPDLTELPLFEEDLVLAVPPDHPLAAKEVVALADLDGMELVLPAPGTAFRSDVDDAARGAGVTLAPKAEVDGVHLIASLTLQGLAPSILPATGATQDLPGFRHIAVADLPPRQVGAVVRRRGRPSAPARATLDVLHQLVADHLGRQYGLRPPAAS